MPAQGMEFSGLGVQLFAESVFAHQLFAGEILRRFAPSAATGIEPIPVCPGMFVKRAVLHAHFQQMGEIIIKGVEHASLGMGQAFLSFLCAIQAHLAGHLLPGTHFLFVSRRPQNQGDSQNTVNG